MKKTVVSAMMVGMMLVSGCSMINYNASKKDYIKRVATERAVASGDQAAVRAVGQGNYVGVGVDLLDPDFWSVLAEHPVRATLAAAADVAAAAAATWAITASSDSSHHDSSSLNVNTTGNGNINNITVGDNNSGHNENFAGDQTEAQ